MRIDESSWKDLARDALDAAKAGDMETARSLAAAAEADRLLSEMPCDNSASTDTN